MIRLGLSINIDSDSSDDELDTSDVKNGDSTEQIESKCYGRS